MNTPDASLIPETWKTVPFAPQYDASSKGRIRGPRKILTAFPRESGYLQVQMAGKQERVSRIVCWTYHGAPPSWDHQAAHLDGVRSNNEPSNLAWKTSKENHEDRIAHGTTCKGETHGMTKLTQAEVMSARQRRANGETVKNIYKDFAHRIALSTLTHAINGRNWK